MAKKRVRFLRNISCRTTAIGLEGSHSFSSGQEVAVDEKLLAQIEKRTGAEAFVVLDVPAPKPAAKGKAKGKGKGGYREGA